MFRYCPKCEAPNAESATHCTACGAPMPGRPVRPARSPKRVPYLPIAIIAAAVLWGAYLLTPNVLEPSPRSRTSRAQSDFRMLATALEAYAIDYETYPQTLWQLSTPVSYLTTPPYDIFPVPPERSLFSRPKPRALPLYARFNAEVTTGGARTVYRSWVLVSCCYDGTFQIDPARDLPPGETLTREEAERRLVDKTYDPSNGAGTPGDIFRLGGGEWFNPPRPAPGSGRSFSGVGAESEGKP